MKDQNRLGMGVDNSLGALESRLIEQTKGLSVAVSLETSLIGILSRLDYLKGRTDDEVIIGLLSEDQEAKRSIGRFFDLGTLGTPMGPAGGTITYPNGAIITIPPGGLPEETIVKVQLLERGQIPVAIPDGLSFITGVSLDLGQIVLSAPAKVALPAAGEISGSLLIAQVVELGPVQKFRLVDVAELVGGAASTKSPPYPGITEPGQYALLEMPVELGVVAIRATTSAGTPVENARVTMSPLHFPVGMPLASAMIQIGIMDIFVGMTGAQGIALIPGQPPNTELVLNGIGSTMSELLSGGGVIPQTELPNPPADPDHLGKLLNGFEELPLDHTMPKSDEGEEEEPPEPCSTDRLVLSPPVDHIGSSNHRLFTVGNSHAFAVRTTSGDNVSAPTTLVDDVVALVKAFITGDCYVTVKHELQITSVVSTRHIQFPGANFISARGESAGVTPILIVVRWNSTRKSKFDTWQVLPLSFKVAPPFPVSVELTGKGLGSITVIGAGVPSTGPFGGTCEKTSASDKSCPDIAFQEADSPGSPSAAFFSASVPIFGSIFIGWSGDCSGNDPVVRIFDDTPISCVARFEPTAQLHITGDRTSNSTLIGAITSDDVLLDCTFPHGFPTCGADIPQNVPIEVKVVLAPGIKVYEWLGDCSGSSDSITITAVSRLVDCKVVFTNGLSTSAVIVTGWDAKLDTDQGTFNCSGLCQVDSSNNAEVLVTLVDPPDPNIQLQTDWRSHCGHISNDARSGSFTSLPVLHAICGVIVTVVPPPP